MKTVRLKILLLVSLSVGTRLLRQTGLYVMLHATNSHYGRWLMQEGHKLIFFFSVSRNLWQVTIARWLVRSSRLHYQTFSRNCSLQICTVMFLSLCKKLVTAFIIYNSIPFINVLCFNGFFHLLFLMLLSCLRKSQLNVWRHMSSVLQVTTAHLCFVDWWHVAAVVLYFWEGVKRCQEVT